MRKLSMLFLLLVVSCGAENVKLGKSGSKINSSENLKLSGSTAVIDVTYRTVNSHRPDLKKLCENSLAAAKDPEFKSLNLIKSDLAFLKATEISSKKECAQDLSASLCLDEIDEFIIRCEYN